MSFYSAARVGLKLDVSSGRCLPLQEGVSRLVLRQLSSTLSKVVCGKEQGTLSTEVPVAAIPGRIIRSWVFETALVLPIH